MAVAAADLSGLHGFLTETVGPIDDIRGPEAAWILGTVERAGRIRPPES
ncbi:hypothetical protein ACGF0D_22545 [Kitasatospora sp. NPDC048298]